MPHCFYCDKYFYETKVNHSVLQSIYCSDLCLEKAKILIKEPEKSYWRKKNKRLLTLVKTYNEIILKKDLH